MGVFRALGNALWFLTGAPLASLLWFVIGGILVLTVVGIPWARACMSLAGFTLLPFGRDVIAASELTGRRQPMTGLARFLGNVVWFVVFGWALVLTHLAAAGICLLASLLIVTAPFTLPMAYAHLKLAGASVWPVGRRVVKAEVAALARQRNAEARLAGYRRPPRPAAAPRAPHPRMYPAPPPPGLVMGRAASAMAPPMRKPRA